MKDLGKDEIVIQITTSATEVGHEIFGLTNYENVAIWVFQEGTWKIYAKENHD